MIHILLRSCLLLWGYTSTITNAASSSNMTPWTCDELTPSLCDLSVSIGHVSVRGIQVKYWRYKRNELMMEEEEEQYSLPIIAIHGGPSWPHGYMLPLKQLACRSSTTEVIFYDQAGCGESNLPEGSNVFDYPHLLTTEYYSEEELPALIAHLKLDRYHILGSSWGTILAQLFALNAQNTSGMVSLILSGPLSDAQRYIQAQWDEKEGNIGSLPPFVQRRILHLQEEKQFDSAEYEAIDEVLTTFFTLRTAPAPDCFTDSAKGLNSEIYVAMQGASEFTIGGVLGDFNVTERLEEIAVPTLLTHGRFDTMRPSTVKTMQRQIRLSERKMMPHSGHVSMIDDAGLMNDVVADFIGRVEEVAWRVDEEKDGDCCVFQPKIWEEDDQQQQQQQQQKEYGEANKLQSSSSSLPQWLVIIITAVLAFIGGMVVENYRKVKSVYSPIV